jgi:hypothetical protein
VGSLSAVTWQVFVFAVFMRQLALFSSHTKSSNTPRSIIPTTAPHSLQRSSIVRLSASTGITHPQHSPDCRKQAVSGSS